MINISTAIIIVKLIRKKIGFDKSKREIIETIHKNEKIGALKLAGEKAMAERRETVEDFLKRGGKIVRIARTWPSLLDWKYVKPKGEYLGDGCYRVGNREKV